MEEILLLASFLPPSLISIYHPQLIRNSTADGHRWTQIKLKIRARKSYDRRVEELKNPNLPIFHRISSSSSSSSVPHFYVSSPVNKKFNCGFQDKSAQVLTQSLYSHDLSAALGRCDSSIFAISPQVLVLNFFKT